MAYSALLLTKERESKAMGKDEEVMQLLERIKRELALKAQESLKMVDPFKDLLHFIESPLDVLSDVDHANKVFEVSDEDNYQCSECKKTFEKSTKLSLHMKKAHKSNVSKKDNETNLSKEKETAIENKSMENEDVGDIWAEMAGGLYQCLVCLASGLTWERRQPTPLSP